jgi:peptidylprolyl isomerase
MRKNSFIYKILCCALLILICQNISAQVTDKYPDLSETASGLRYKIITQGAGDFPKPGDRVWVNYIATFENDSIYDSTTESGPLDVYLGHGQLIKGWEEGLQLVRPGGSIILVVPPALGYGSLAHNSIPANSTLIFEISLLQVNAGEVIKPFSTENCKLQKGKKKLRYYTIHEGKGELAISGDNAYVNYTGYLPDGTIFDSSHKKGEPVRITVGINQVIEGWDMGLQLMKKEGKIKLIIPPELAYGSEGNAPIIPPNTIITLDIELVDLVPPEPVEKWNISGKKVIETPTGLKYVVFEQGVGELIENENIVEVHYSGYFTNGELFDSSVKRFEPIRFPVGAGVVIDGWEEGLKLMRKAAKFQLMVPSYLGYGTEGSPPIIPADTDLIFDIEVIEVIK